MMFNLTVMDYMKLVVLKFFCGFFFFCGCMGSLEVCLF